MKAIQTGNEYRIYSNSMHTYDELPAQSYLVNFDPNQGFFLTLYADIEIKEKIYGVHEAKVNKVLNTFNHFNRNLGVILSGDKGIGKSLFSKMLAQKAIEQGLPLIIVNSYVRGIAEYLNQIEQEVVVLFDEFDKVFQRLDNLDPQAEMLSLFDGIAQGKKLFVVTCNNLNQLNSFLVNRPGRFHYHFRFQYPTSEDITQYLQEHLDKVYWTEIKAVISFSKKINLNYDCLRAIAFELNCGSPFEEAIKDLNIINLKEDRYNLVLQLSNGEQLRKYNYPIDLFSDEENSIEFDDVMGRYDLGKLSFIPSDNIFDTTSGNCIIPQNSLTFSLYDYLNNPNDEEDYNIYTKYKDVKPIKLIFHRQKETQIHYSV
jgi:hypothetical protein